MTISDAEIELAVKQHLANIEDLLNPAPVGSLSHIAKVVLNRRPTRQPAVRHLS